MRSLNFSKLSKRPETTTRRAHGLRAGAVPPISACSSLLRRRSRRSDSLASLACLTAAGIIAIATVAAVGGASLVVLALHAKNAVATAVIDGRRLVQFCCSGSCRRTGGPTHNGAAGCEKSSQEPPGAENAKHLTGFWPGTRQPTEVPGHVFATVVASPRSFPEGPHAFGRVPCLRLT